MCFMLADRIRRALPDLPPQLRAAAEHLAAHPFEAATRSMRAMAAECGASPASFSRLAQALGFAGWEALREAAIVESRHAAPYSSRAGRSAPRDGAVAEADQANLAALAALSAGAIEAASATLHQARRIHVAGFRSCRAVAVLLHYQLSLFRGDVSLVGDAVLDFDLGAMRRGDALALIGFAPYSRASLAAMGAARAAGLATVVLADSATAPIAAGASHLLLFPTATPAFFPSLTAAVALAQVLAAATFTRGGRAALARLRESEARLDAFAAYLPESEDP